MRPTYKEKHSQSSPPSPVYDADLIQAYLNEIGNHHLLTPKQEQSLARSAREGDTQARETLTRCNLKLVVNLAKPFQGRGLPLLDLIQEGNQGLMRAVDRFDPEKGFRFSTYARWWIRQGLQRACQDQGRVIRLPVHVQDKLRLLRNHREALRQALGRDPAPPELAEACDIKEQTMAAYRRSADAVGSLDAGRTDGDDTSWGARVSAPESAEPEPRCLAEDGLADLRAALEVLDERELLIIRQRFGLDASEPQTLSVLGEKLGITRERTRQLQTRALAKLKGQLGDRGPPAFER